MFKYYNKLFQNYEYHSKSTDLFYRPSKNIYLVRQSLQEVWNRIIKNTQMRQRFCMVSTLKSFTCVLSRGHNKANIIKNRSTVLTWQKKKLSKYTLYVRELARTGKRSFVSSQQPSQGHIFYSKRFV